MTIYAYKKDWCLASSNIHNGYGIMTHLE